MPEPQTILNHLARAANEAIVLAGLWHAALAVAVGALARGWRPPARRARTMLAAPLASASVVAFFFGNPFNAIVLGVGASVLFALGLGTERPPSAPAPLLVRLTAVAMIAFGAFYPHFLEGHSPMAYSVAAPMGVIPCPTLSVMIGWALFANGLGSRTWSLSLAALGMFYGVFGVFRLQVHLDMPLLVGAAALAVVALRHPSSGRLAPPVQGPGGRQATMEVGT